MKHTEHYYEMQKMLNEYEQKWMAQLEHSNRIIDRMNRGEWEEDDSSSQSSNHYGKSDYYGNGRRLP